LEQNIYGNQANTLAAMGRNSTNASQQLALAGAVQGNTNDAFGNLATMEAQDKQRRFGDMAYAGQGVQQQYGNLQNIYQNQSNQAQNSANLNGQASQINSFNALQGIGNAAMTFLPGMLGQPQPAAQQAYSPFSPMGVRQSGILGMINGNPYNQPYQQPQVDFTLPGLSNFYKSKVAPR
jgi:hypothetical protein